VKVETVAPLGSALIKKGMIGNDLYPSEVLIKTQKGIDPVLHHLACRIGTLTLEAR